MTTAVAPSRDLRSRTPSEELWLWRYRQLSLEPRRTIGRSGSAPSQAEAAQYLGVTTARYHDAEVGKLHDRDVKEILSLTGGDGKSPSPGELCALARRRAGWTLSQAAKKMGVSHVTYLERERAGLAREMWEAEGFRF